jgi:hypothetical protein
MYNIGDTIIIDEEFEYDSVDFYIGNQGTVVGIEQNFIAISWTNKNNPSFHDFNGTSLVNNCWCIPASVLKKKAHVEFLKEANGNPLPEDPRLRGIALKIVQLESKFKRYQELKKSGQLHLLDEDNYEEEEEEEYDEDYDSNDYETVRG